MVQSKITGVQMRKITGEMIIDKLKELPESDQQTILDFIEYLMKKQERKQKKSVDKKKAVSQ
jgi:hypothetical protein